MDEKIDNLQWCEVTKVEVKGHILCIKDAMVMLDEDELIPDWPYVNSSPGHYVFEIFIKPKTFNAYKARLRKIGSEPTVGQLVGKVDVDNGFIALIDHELFHKTVTSNYQKYTDWTVHELDDELASNFSGKIKFNEMDLLYVQSGDGDGSYNCYGLSEKNQIVGIECVFKEIYKLN